MKEAIVATVRCPHCGKVAGITQGDVAPLWLSHSSWQCQRCERIIRRRDTVIGSGEIDEDNEDEE